MAHPRTVREFDAVHAEARALMLVKNAAYGDAWRLKRASSITDEMLMKLHRLRNLEDRAARGGMTPDLAANIEAELLDVHNWAAFGLMKHRETYPAPGPESHGPNGDATHGR